MEKGSRYAPYVTTSSQGLFLIERGERSQVDIEKVSINKTHTKNQPL